MHIVKILVLFFINTVNIYNFYIIIKNTGFSSVKIRIKKHVKKRKIKANEMSTIFLYILVLYNNKNKDKIELNSHIIGNTKFK